MARPKYTEGDVQALDKLEQAFWEALEQTPYAKMSVRGIVAAAGLNKNTFYYHFGTLDDLARYCVNRSLPSELGKIVFLQGSTAGTRAFEQALASQTVKRKFARVRLMLSPNAQALQGIVSDELVSIWKSILSEPSAGASEQRDLLLKFAAGGLVKALHGKLESEYAPTVDSLRTSGALDGLIKALEDAA